MRLVANTLVTRPGTLEAVSLMAGEEVPDWAVGLVGDHLLDVPVPVEPEGGPEGESEGGPEGESEGGPAGESEGGPDGEPDGSWTVVELREYAREHGIDLEGATAKADILAAVKG